VSQAYCCNTSQRTEPRHAVPGQVMIYHCGLSPPPSLFASPFAPLSSSAPSRAPPHLQHVLSKHPLSQDPSPSLSPCPCSRAAPRCRDCGCSRCRCSCWEPPGGVGGVLRVGVADLGSARPRRSAARRPQSCAIVRACRRRRGRLGRCSSHRDSAGSRPLPSSLVSGRLSTGPVPPARSRGLAKTALRVDQDDVRVFVPRRPTPVNLSRGLR